MSGLVVCPEVVRSLDFADARGKGAIPKWNFHKIIIGKDGKVAETFTSITNPSSKRFINFIEEQIKS